MEHEELLCELLQELRIDKNCLEVMANGQSTNRKGAIDTKVGEEYYFPYPVVQLSTELATKLLRMNT